jgi:hypothetical protein
LRKSISVPQSGQALFSEIGFVATGSGDVVTDLSTLANSSNFLVPLHLGYVMQPKNSLPA